MLPNVCNQARESLHFAYMMLLGI